MTDFESSPADPLHPGAAAAVPAGLSAPAALRLLGEELPGGKARRAVRAAAARVAAGEDVAAALAAVRADLPPGVASLLDLPAIGPLLPAALVRAAGAAAERGEDRRKLRWAIGWPLLAAAVTGTAAASAAAVVASLMAPLYEDFGLTLSPLTEAVLAAGRAVVGWWFVLLPAALVLLAGLAWLVLRPGPAGPLAAAVRPAEYARWCDLAAFFVSERVPLPDALRAAAWAGPDPRVSGLTAEIAAATEDGVPPADAARVLPGVPPAVRAALRWADSPDALAEALANAAGVLRATAAGRLAPTGLFAVALQPALVLLAGLLLGTVTLATVLPLVELLNDLS